MALRAGYYGVKRRIWEALQTTVAKSVQDITDIWNNNTITGVHNLFSVPTGYSVKSGSSVSYSDGVYTITTNTTNDAGMYFSAGATLRPSLAAFVGIKGKLSFEYKAEAAFNGVVGFDTTIKYSTSFVKYEADITDLSQIPAIVFYDRDTTSGHTITVKNMMIKLADDPVDDVTPFAMTNQQLTNNQFIKNIYLGSSDNLNNITETGIYFIQNQPTNSIAGWATLIVGNNGSNNIQQMLFKAGSGAAEGVFLRKTTAYDSETGVYTFSNWFKIAATEVTPSTLTSLDPETRAEVEDEPVEVVKKSTRKSTKKTEEEV